MINEQGMRNASTRNSSSIDIILMIASVTRIITHRASLSSHNLHQLVTSCLCMLAYTCTPAAPPLTSRLHATPKLPRPGHMWVWPQNVGAQATPLAPETKELKK